MQENQAYSTNKVEQQNNQAIDLKSIYYLCLSHWYWFLISVLLSLGIVTFYLLKTTPIYTRSAKVLVKSDEKGRSAVDVSDFSDMGLVSNGVKINNELLTIKSIDNIEEVVRRLHLDMNYTSDGLFHQELLYDKSLPVFVDLIGIADNTGVSFEMKIKAEELVLTDFVMNKEEKSGKITTHFGDTVNTPVGPVCVHATEFYNVGEK